VASRESINRVKVERFRASGIPVNSAETIYQGDLMVWDAAAHRATVGTAPSAGTFCGMSETKNPIGTLGSPEFLSDLASSRINLIQGGLVEVIASASETLYPYDPVTLATTSAQHIVKSGATLANKVGVVDPKWATAAGKAVVLGDLVRIWLQVRPQYSVEGPAAASAS
jgi:hypothetical protein